MQLPPDTKLTQRIASREPGEELGPHVGGWGSAGLTFLAQPPFHPPMSAQRPARPPCLSPAPRLHLRFLHQPPAAHVLGTEASPVPTGSQGPKPAEAQPQGCALPGISGRGAAHAGALLVARCTAMVGRPIETPRTQTRPPSSVLRDSPGQRATSGALLLAAVGESPGEKGHGDVLGLLRCAWRGPGSSRCGRQTF